MFSYPVQFKRPATIEEATKLLSDPDAKFLAGGQSLVAAMKIRLAAPSSVVSLAGIPDLDRIEIDSKGVLLGAMVRHAAVAGSAGIRKLLPALASLAGSIGDRMVRNMGTVGGSVANNDPAADYPAAVLALQADILTDRRAIAADDFFKGLYETALQPAEPITAIRFRVPRRAAYLKFKQPASRFATVGVFVADFDGDVRVAVTGAGSCVFRVGSMEAALAADFSPASLRGIQVPAADLSSDIHASADYRAHLIGVLAGRAVAAARG
ncbi:MAG: carbon monoxide dehydrogenase [Ramlibacter sp.]|jgi:carbon-monoxide dehydrogenase medium subunit|nr:carbon monoxide dehydrogenase [Ramlibacter sp.]MDB5914388.1 carbon monoxide dehydrogenase [Ramlibacter sp.]